MSSVSETMTIVHCDIRYVWAFVNNPKNLRRNNIHANKRHIHTHTHAHRHTHRIFAQITFTIAAMKMN